MRRIVSPIAIGRTPPSGLDKAMSRDGSTTSRTPAATVELRSPASPSASGVISARSCLSLQVPTRANRGGSRVARATRPPRARPPRAIPRPRVAGFLPPPGIHGALTPVRRPGLGGPHLTPPRIVALLVTRSVSCGISSRSPSSAIAAAVSVALPPYLRSAGMSEPAWGQLQRALTAAAASGSASHARDPAGSVPALLRAAAALAEGGRSAVRPPCQRGGRAARRDRVCRSPRAAARPYRSPRPRRPRSRSRSQVPQSLPPLDVGGPPGRVFAGFGPPRAPLGAPEPEPEWWEAWREFQARRWPGEPAWETRARLQLVRVRVHLLCPVQGGGEVSPCGAGQGGKESVRLDEACQVAVAPLNRWVRQPQASQAWGEGSLVPHASFLRIPPRMAHAAGVEQCVEQRLAPRDHSSSGRRLSRVVRARYDIRLEMHLVSSSDAACGSRIVASLCVLMYDLAAWIIASLPPWTATQYWSGRKWARAASASEESADFAARRRTHSPTAMGRVPPSGLARAMRREDVSKEHTSSGSIVLTRAWRWVVTAALAIAASLRCSNVIPDGPSPTPFSQRHRIFANAAEVMVTTWASSIGVQSMCPGGAASQPVGSRSPVLGLSPRLAAARFCHLVMPVAIGGGSPVPYSPRPFGVASAALASPSTLDESRRVWPPPPREVAPTPVPAFVLAPAADVAPLPAPGAAPSPAPPVPVLPSPATAAADAAVVAPASGVAPLPAPVLAAPLVVPVALPVAPPAASLGAPGGGSALPLPMAPSSAPFLPPAAQQRNSRPHPPSPRDERDVSRRRRDSPRRRQPQANWHAHQGGWGGAQAVSLPAPSPPDQFGGAGLPQLRLPSLAEELRPPRAETLAHGSLPPVPAESLLDGPRDDCLDAADQIALLLAPVLAAPVRGSVGAVGQLDSAVRDLRRYLRAVSGADAIGATILVVCSVWQTMTGILDALQADRM
ncbi:unnamed protein product [Closterium sp. Naga37s-1]|nr:unnamed protein product [Closterium sp. Naga37s-1]